MAVTAGPIAPNYLTTIFCLVFPALGFAFSMLYTMHTRAIKLQPGGDNESAALVVNNDKNDKLWQVYSAIYEGAHSFLYAEYYFIAIFMALFSVVILLVLGFGGGGNKVAWVNAVFTVISFLVGASTSVVAGFIGMKIGVYANARTALKSADSLAAGFTTAFKAAVVMGFCLVSFGIFNAFILITLLRLYYKNAMNWNGQEATLPNAANETQYLFEAVAGFGLGGSSIALFGRVGGGIYTKAADVGADLVGKIEAGIPEDDPRNPAVIADNVGDNVGDIAGMGADLFGSFAEATCAALVIASQTAQGSPTATHHSSVWPHWSVISFPLIVSCVGLFGSFLTTFYCTHVAPPVEVDQIEPTLKRGLLLSTILVTPLLYMAAAIWLPVNIGYIGGNANVKNWEVFICGACGLWSGLIIGYITEYYTSNAYQPVQELADSCRTGAATNIIFGLALGYKSVIIPAMALALSVYISITLAGFYGIAIAALGILSTLSFGLTIDAFGPISDNAGGVAEMCEMGDEVRERTDALDAAGNTTAAIGKGFAIGSAAFVSLALFSGFVTITKNRPGNSFGSGVNILTAFPFAGLLIGAMLPYWFTAMTMKSVGKAALEMVNEVREQFANNPGILQGTTEPDYDRCIRISTEASLYEMMWPGVLVMFTPLVVGFFFGTLMLAGVLAGALVSGVQMAISQSNTGGAWDNAKKYVEKDGLGESNGKGSECHKAAVVGDTVGDPLKDTSGPSLNILIKLMAIISLVFARSFPVTQGGLAGLIAQAARK